MIKPIDLLVTFGGVGYLRPAPGTWGSAAALPFGMLIQWNFGSGVLLAAALLLYATGVLLGGIFLATSEHPDPGNFVLDEVAGQWLTMVAAPASLLGALMAFLAFRFFDVLKPWPVSLIDRKVKGALGVMTDDMMAGLYGLLFLLALGTFLR